MKSKRIRQNGDGFTLIELLVVMAILSILASIGVPAYFRYVEKAQLVSSASAVEIVRKRLEVYNIEYGSYPTTLNFPDLTDGDGQQVLNNGELLNTVNGKINGWVSYTYVAGNSYDLRASAKNSALTEIRATPQSIAY